MTEEQARAASMPTEDDFTHYFNATARLSAECERLRAALFNLYDYCEDHNWGTIPVGKTIEAAEDLVRELRADEQKTRDINPRTGPDAAWPNEQSAPKTLAEKVKEASRRPVSDRDG